jgi:hypothetical protein
VYNINNGIVAKDSITFDNATSITTTRYSANGHASVTTKATAAALSFTGLFGCAEAYKQCTPQSPANCVNQSSDCPEEGAVPSNLFQDQCPGSGSGIEAGWTFNVGGPASAMAVPEQVFKAGLISKKVVSGLLWPSMTAVLIVPVALQK